MLATLGGQPQIITFALDALLEQGENISEVIVLYLSDSGGRVTRAMAKVAAEFVDDTYAGRPCRLRPMPLRGSNIRLHDIRNEVEANATWEMLRDLVTDLKNEDRQLHVCMSGGQRIMALLLMSVATLQFSYHDKLWHVYTPRDVQAQADEGAIMHARAGDDIRLIQVPMAPLGMHFPALRQLTQAAPATINTFQSIWLEQVDRERCEQVISQLRPRELETLKLFATGLSPQEVAEAMTITLNTVNTYRKTIFDLCRNAWPEQDNIRYHHLREWFGPYFEL